MSRRAGVVVLVAVVTALGSAASATAHHRSTSPLDGRWTFTWTPSMVKKTGADPSLSDSYVVEFRNGSFLRLLPLPVARKARFTTRGDLATFVFTVPTTGVVTGRPYTMRFSIYRNRLTWSRVPGRAGLDLFSAVPWTRGG